MSSSFDTSIRSYSGTATSSFSANFAQRMAGRLQQLQTEQDRLQVAQVAFAQVQQQWKESSTETHQVRREWLEAIRQRHGMELELAEAEEDATQQRHETLELRQETQVLQVKTATLQSQWQDLVQTMYAPHTTRRDTYAVVVQAHVDACESARARRQEQLRMLHEQAVALQDETAWTVQQRNQVQEEQQDAELLEQQENDTVQALALQVRAELAKRSELRNTLRKVQDVYQDASQQAEQLEHEYLSSSGP